MDSIFLAISPIFFLILLGWLFENRGFPGTGFWPLAEKITYYVFFPALLFSSLYQADFSQAGFLGLTLVIGSSMLAVTAAMLVMRPLLKLSGPDFSSVFQGGLRPNTYVGISAAFIILGQEGLSLAAMVMSVMIPLANLISVTVVTVFGQNQRKGWLQGLNSVAGNPLILACILGYLANISGLPLVMGTRETISILSQAALSLGLLSVGAGLRFKGLAAKTGPLLWAATFKLAALPLLTGILALMAGLGEPAVLICILFTSLPCGAAAYVMARQLGGGLDMMAAVITVQTVAALVTIPAVMGVFRAFLGS
ncbi:MAG: AEC family transporter [Desulfonatronovibrionaceae bacterium]